MTHEESVEMWLQGICAGVWTLVIIALATFALHCVTSKK